MRDKYESELKELEESERNMQEKYNNMKVGAKYRRSRQCLISHIERFHGGRFGFALRGYYLVTRFSSSQLGVALRDDSNNGCKRT